MADSASRAQRAAALEEKRRKLDELKKKRALRDQGTAKVKASTSANLDEYIDGLLSQPSGPSHSAQSSLSDKPKDSSDKKSETAASAEDRTVGPPSDETQNNVIAQPAPAPVVKKVETFAVSTQTEPEDFPEQNEEEEPEVPEEPALKQDATETANGDKVEEKEEKIPKVLSVEEIEKEVVATPFTSFINTASKKVERVIGNQMFSDLLADYIGETDSVERTEVKDSDMSRFVSSRQVYECEKWTATRDMTDISWSPLHRDLLLATYHAPNSAIGSSPLSKGSAAVSAISPKDTLSSSLTPRSGELQSDGLALVWSLSMPNRPEHIFTCGSPVTAGRLHPSESTLVLGGCESGQLVVWDVRAGRLPVQKSALTTVVGAGSKNHTHSIGAMEVIEGGLGLVTASTEGRVNFWSLANLREPAESFQVGESVSCFAVAPESESLLLGDEHGLLHSIGSSSQGSGQRSSRKHVRKLDSTNSQGDPVGHYGMVTSISAKVIKAGSSLRAAGLSKGFLRGSGGLVLSSGVDWTVKLWSPASSDAPLVNFVSHSYDYMSDVKWNPLHPSLFATASSNGTVGLWNIATSLEEPITGKDGIVVEPDALSGRGLNKLQWSSDGRRLAIASGDRLHVLHVTEDVARPKGDEDQKTMNHLMARGLITRQ